MTLLYCCVCMIEAVPSAVKSFLRRLTLKAPVVPKIDIDVHAPLLSDETQAYSF